MSWRQLRTVTSPWNFWRATTPAQTKWMLTNGCSAMRWPETRACSLGRTMSKRRGGSLILCSRQALRSTATSQVAGGRVRSKREFYRLVGGITRRWRAEGMECWTKRMEFSIPCFGGRSATVILIIMKAMDSVTAMINMIGRGGEQLWNTSHWTFTRSTPGHGREYARRTMVRESVGTRAWHE